MSGVRTSSSIRWGRAHNRCRDDRARVASLKSGKSESLLASTSGATIHLVDLIADITGALESDHVLEARARRDRDRRERLPRVLVADVLDEQQNQDVILVLAGIHPPAQLVAALPERRIQLRLLQRHRNRPVAFLNRPVAFLELASPRDSRPLTPT